MCFVFPSCSQSVRFHAKSWLPARSIVMECLAARQTVDPSGEIMVLDRFCPVSSHYNVSDHANVLIYFIIAELSQS